MAEGNDMKTTAEESAEAVRLKREEFNKAKLVKEKTGSTKDDPKGTGTAGQGNNKQAADQALGEAAKKAVFVELGKEGTLMITQPGEYKGIYQPPIVMITQSGMSRIDKDRMIKSQWMRFSMLATTRMFNALKENSDYLNQYAQKELEEVTGMAPIE